MKRFVSILLIALMCSMVLVGCGKKVVSSGTTSAVKNSESEAETVNYSEELLNINDIENPSLEGVDEDYQERDPKKGDTVATIHTSFGDISFRLFKEVAPLAVNNFIALAKDGRYDNTIFHRVISGFMIQGGDYEKFNGTGGTSAYGQEFKNETSDYASNIAGAVAMANAGPDTNGSQFYINQVDNKYLDGGYTVFGQVYEGMDIVDTIASVNTDSSDKPVDDVLITSIDIKEFED